MKAGAVAGQPAVPRASALTLTVPRTSSASAGIFRERRQAAVDTSTLSPPPVAYHRPAPAMASYPEPAAEIAPLPNADGSVAFSYAGYKVIASANGPIETMKRDEYAFEAFVDVNVRPPAGIGGESLSLIHCPLGESEAYG